MLADAEESADSDDRVGQRLVWCHDQVVDLADLVTGVVVDVLPENLLLRAPPLGDFSQLGGRDADDGRPGRLRGRIGGDDGNEEADERHKDHCFHGFLLSTGWLHGRICPDAAWASTRIDTPDDPFATTRPRSHLTAQSGGLPKATRSGKESAYDHP